MTLPRLLDREAELASLEDTWARTQAGQPQLFLLWGRRRVGKTFLLTHFVQRKRAVFFGATQQAEGIELRRLAEAIRRDVGPRVADLAGDSFSSWEAALRFFAALAAEEPLAVVLDEAAYLTQSTPGFASIVQVVWDHLRPGARLMLVLSGSAIGTMERMIGGGGALHGRPTAALRMEPLDAFAARVVLPQLEAADFLQAYAACGGYPLHLGRWRPDLSMEANLIELAGTPGGVLREDAEGILREELPGAGGYPQILAAIGRGRTRYSEIASDAEQRIEHPLDVLVTAGFVQKLLPIGAPRGARPSYQITDPYLRFWFHVLYTDLALIDGGQGEAVIRRARPRWKTHLGFVFEEVARGHARRMVRNGDLPPDLVVGRWWSSRGEPVEVDVLGLRERRTHLLGEAKWQTQPLGRAELEALRRRADRVPRPIERPLLALWGRGGVSEEVRGTGALGFGPREMLDAR